MPWCVTHSIWRSVSRRSSERRRTAWTPGIINVPRPVMILKPRLSSSPLFRWGRPEMISASFGSAMRQVLLKSSTRSRTRISAAPIPPATTAVTNELMFMVPPVRSGWADYDGTRREVLDHDDSDALWNGLSRIGRVGVEGLAATPHGNHHLPEVTWAHDSRHPPHPANHLLVEHGAHHSSTKRTLRRHRRVVRRGTLLRRRGRPKATDLHVCYATCCSQPLSRLFRARILETCSSGLSGLSGGHAPPERTGSRHAAPAGVALGLDPVRVLWPMPQHAPLGA